MFVKNIDKNIQEALKAKERAFAKKTSGTNDSVDVEGTLKFSDMASRTFFARMVSNRQSPVIIQGGRLEENESGALKNVFGNKVYKKNEDGTRRTNSGIKDISVEYKGQHKAIKIVTVNWTAGSLEELDDLIPHFLTPGLSTMVDYGWVYKNKPFPTTFLTAENTVNPDVFTSPSKLIKESDGRYDAVAGPVSNFNYKLNEDGTFDCTTTITALGVNLFDNTSIDKNPTSTVIPAGKIRTNVNSRDAKIIYENDGLVNAIINLPRILLHDYWGVEYKPKLENAQKITRSDSMNTSQQGFRKELRLGKLSRYFSKANSENLPSGLTVYRSGTVNNIYPDHFQYVEHNGLTEDGDTTHKDIIFSNSVYDANHREDWYVRWGWFEDHILSRYSTLLNDNGDLLNAFRSINQVKLDNGEFASEPVKIRNNIYLNLPLDIFKFILPGQVPTKNLFLKPDTFGPDETDSLFADLTAHITKVLNVNSTTKPFMDESNNDLGILRNVMINVTEIQKAFGIKDPDKVNEMKAKNIIGPEMIEPPSTISDGVKNLAAAFSKNYHDYWDFKVVNDTDTNRIKLIDSKSTEIKKYTYTEYEDNSHKVSDLGIYKFPSFQQGSFVKSQNLESKIIDGVTATIVMGSNSNENQKTDLNLTQEEPSLKMLFSQNKGPEYKDSFLNELESAYKVQRNKNLSNKIGAQYENPRVSDINQTVKLEGSFPISYNSKWWSTWAENDNSFANETDNVIAKMWESIKNKVTDHFTSIIDGLKETYPKLWDWLGGDEADLAVLPQTKEALAKEVESAYKKNLSGKYQKNRPFYILNVDSEDETPYQATLINSLEGFIKENLYFKAKDSDVFKSDITYPIDLSIVIDGISGIYPGDCIQSDYMPKHYNEDYKGFGPFAFFQIMNITQNISSDGWETEITTVMRSNHNALYKYAEDFKEEVNESSKIEEEKQRIDSGPEPKRPPTVWPDPEEEDIAGDLDEGNLDFDELDDFSDMPKPAAPPPVPYPKIEVPSDDEDIAGDLTLDELDFDDFSQLEPPPPIPEPVVIEVFKKKEEQEPEPEPIPIVSTKVEVRPVKPVYAGSYNQNELLYSQREDWRPIYKRPNGTLTGERKTNGVSNTQVRSALTKSKRAEYYNQFIEVPNQTGKSVIPDYGDFKYTITHKPGMITRTNRDKWWKTPKDE